MEPEPGPINAHRLGGGGEMVDWRSSLWAFEGSFSAGRLTRFSRKGVRCRGFGQVVPEGGDPRTLEDEQPGLLKPNPSDQLGKPVAWTSGS